MARSLVTVATDGFRDYVELPDGRTLNMGSVSVLKLVTSLVQSPALCRRALDSFVKTNRAVVQIDLEGLEKLLQPKRSRWAHGNGLIPSVPQQDEGMTDQVQPTPVQASFDGLLTAFDALYQTPSPETISAFGKSASDFFAHFKGAEDETDESKPDTQAKEAAVATENGVTGPAEDVAKQMKVENPYAGKDQSDNSLYYKLAATEVPFVNEGLVHLVVAKVDAALKAVQASSKKGRDAARGDLHTISTRLDGIAKRANFQDPALRTALLDLAQKADKVRAFFV